MKTTIVNFILDKSGSMGMVREATISGFNEYIQTLKKDKKNKYKFTLTLFDTEVSHPITDTDIKDVDDLSSETYNPDGMTALYDAVCSTINGVKAKKGQKVLTIIMTDGQENSSKEYTEKEMKKLVDEKTAEDWKFVYLGANQDSYATAQKFGVSAANVANFNATGKGVMRSMNMMATNTAMYACSADSNADFFTKADQTELETTK